MHTLSTVTGVDIWEPWGVDPPFFRVLEDTGPPGGGQTSGICVARSLPTSSSVCLVPHLSATPTRRVPYSPKHQVPWIMGSAGGRTAAQRDRDEANL